MRAGKPLHAHSEPMSKRPAFPALAVAATAVAVMLLATYLDKRHQQQYQAELRSAAEKAAVSSARQLQSEIRDKLASANRLGIAYASQVGGDHDLFRFYAEQELLDSPEVVAVAIAPGFELGTLFSRPDSSGIDTLDEDKFAEDIRSRRTLQSPSIETGFNSGQLTLVHTVATADRSEPSRAAVALVLDKKRIMADAGVGATDRSSRAHLTNLDWFEVALRDLSAVRDQIFFGDPAIEDRDPIRWHVTVGNNIWQILIAPTAGWNVIAPDQTEYRFQLALGGLALIIPILMASVLIGERNRNIVTLQTREANLLELSQRFNLAMEASNIGIWEVTDDGRHLFWDERAAALHGCPEGGFGNRLEEWHAAIYPEDRAAAEAHFFTCICAKQACSETYRIATAAGAVRYLRSAGAAFHNPDGSVRTTGIVWDVTSDMLMTQTLRDAKAVSDIKNAELELALDELSRREQELEELSNKLDLALASYKCGIWEFEPAAGVERWDERMCQLYGIAYTDGIISQKQWFDLLHPDDRAAARQVSARFQKTGLQDSLVVRIPQADGSLRYIRSVGQLQVDRDGRRKIIGIAFDVTEDAMLTAELKAAKAESDAKNAELELAKNRIEHNALHDPLTGLGNRRKLDMELDQLSRQSATRRLKFAILHLDLDRFKQINDTLGHAAGDAMLVYASDVLSRNVRPSDIVARIGGDEFVILIPDGGEAEDVARLAARIIHELRQPIDFEGFACRCGVSIGIAQGNGINIDARRVLVNADIALYRAKAMGRNRYEFFTQNLQAEIISHKRTADDLLAGIENHEFVTWYQPQFDAQTNLLTGVEALVRWNHPHLGILAPDRFLKIAEDLNVAATIDHIVLETVLRDQARWADVGIDVPRVSVNVSSRRLHDENLIDSLKALQIRRNRISFELVESIFLDEHEDIVAGNLEEIRKLGIDIEIDDFGTGHTSIVGLLKLKPHRLKIDRQLVMPILHSPQERALVRSIIDIARSLGVETVAEGVETMQHTAMLRELGCDLLQGYAFARPLPFADFTQAALSGWTRAAA